MSVRNGLPYLEQTIRSVLAQTFQDWEFVIVDNASTDGTPELIDGFARTEARIRLLRNTTDLGHSGGLNAGLEHCHGIWVARIDADDIALPERLDQQLAFLRANPDVGVTSCLAYYINAEGKRSGKTFHDLTTREAFAEYMRKDLAIGILHPGTMIDRQLLQQAGGYREQFGAANDIDLWARLCEAGAIILVQDEYLMEYRIHTQSIIAHDFEEARLQYQWARDCMRARRHGLTEPSWESYLEERRNAPLWKRFNRWRKTQARRLYRQSARNAITRHAIRAGIEILGAAVLQPGYTVPRLKGQILK